MFFKNLPPFSNGDPFMVFCRVVHNKTVLSNPWLTIITYVMNTSTDLIAITDRTESGHITSLYHPVCDAWVTSSVIQQEMALRKTVLKQYQGGIMTVWNSYEKGNWTVSSKHNYFRFFFQTWKLLSCIVYITLDHNLVDNTSLVW